MKVHTYRFIESTYEWERRKNRVRVRDENRKDGPVRLGYREVVLRLGWI